MNANCQSIGVFDSGVGGVSVLHHLIQKMPHENFIYLGDSANAPYGSKSSKEIEELVMDNSRYLIDQGCKALVIACNTATAAAIQGLRNAYTQIPIIGIEPALKPAVEQCPRGKILVMATEATLKEDKFLRLKTSFEQDAHIMLLAPVGLVEFIEKGDLNSPELELFLSELLAPYGRLDALVLGCTHYPFVRPLLQKILGPKVLLIDGGAGTAKETLHQLEHHQLISKCDLAGKVIFQNSVEANAILSQKLLEQLGGIQ